MFSFAVDPVFTPSERERIARHFFPLYSFICRPSIFKINFQFRKFCNLVPSDLSSNRCSRKNDLSWRPFIDVESNSSWKGWHSMVRGMALSGRSRAIERSVEKKVLGREGQSELKLLKRVTRWKKRRRTSIQSAVYAVVSLPAFVSSYFPSFFPFFSRFPLFLSSV